MQKMVKKVAVGVAVGTVGGVAFADTGVDASAIVSIITGAVTTISAVGLAVLSLVTTIKLFKWVQRVL